MDKEQFKIFLSEVLKESGKLELEVTEYGDVYIALKIDNKEILKSEIIDIKQKIKESKYECTKISLKSKFKQTNIFE